MRFKAAGELRRVDLGPVIDLLPAMASAVFDLATLERRCRAVPADGWANRFRGARLEVRASATRWAITGEGALRARGLGRLVLWFAGRRIRSSVDGALAGFRASSESRTAALEKETSRLRTAIDKEGGPAPFVRRALWDEDFDLGLESLRSHRNRH